MTIEIRNVRTDEYADYVRAIGTGFLDRPDADRVAEQVSTALGARPDLGGVRRRPDLRDVPVVGDRADRPRRPGAAGVRRRRGHGAAHPSAAGHPDPTRGGRARGDPGSRRGASGSCTPPSTRSTAGSATGRAAGSRPGRCRSGAPGSTASPASSVELMAPGADAVATIRSCSRRGDRGSRARSGAATSAGTTTSGSGQPVGPAVEGVPRGPSRRRRQARRLCPLPEPRSSRSIASPRARSLSTSSTRSPTRPYAALWRFLAEVDLSPTVRPAAGARPSACGGC